MENLWDDLQQLFGLKVYNAMNTTDRKRRETAGCALWSET